MLQYNECNETFNVVENEIETQMHASLHSKQHLAHLRDGLMELIGVGWQEHVQHVLCAQLPARRAREPLGRHRAPRLRTRALQLQHVARFSRERLGDRRVKWKLGVRAAQERVAVLLGQVAERYLQRHSRDSRALQNRLLHTGGGFRASNCLLETSHLVAYALTMSKFMCWSIQCIVMKFCIPEL